MNDCNVALYGCGTVGGGVARALLNSGALAERIGAHLKLKYVVDARLAEVRRDVQPPQSVTLTDVVRLARWHIGSGPALPRPT